MNRRKKFWLFFDEEIQEITIKVIESLCLSDYNWDFEDTWEWCETKDKTDEIYFNIAREGYWGKTRYDCPVIVEIRRKYNDFTDAEMIEIGKKVANKLKVDVHFGFITYLQESKYQCDDVIVINTV